MEHSIDTELRHSIESSVEGDEGRVVFFLDAEPGVPARVTKLLGYHHTEQTPAGDGRHLGLEHGQRLDERAPRAALDVEMALLVLLAAAAVAGSLRPEAHRQCAESPRRIPVDFACGRRACGQG
jgi:hypothetical protein